MNIGVFMFFQISVLGSFGYISRIGIAGSKGRPIFNFLSYLHTAFHSGCTSLPSHQQCKRVLFFSTSSSALVCWFIDDKQFHRCEIPIVVLICISLIISDMEHLLLCLLAICIQVLPHFFNSVIWVFLVLSFFGYIPRSGITGS